MRTKMTLFTTLLASALAACMAGDAPPDDPGDDEPPGDDGPSDGTGPSGFVTAFAQSECAAAHQCESSFPSDAGVTFAEIFGSSLAECETIALEYYQPDAVRDAVNDGTIDYDREAAEDCLDNMNWGSCTQFFNGESPLPASCGMALVGNVADGGQCSLDLECSSDESWCGDGGTCEPFPTGP